MEDYKNILQEYKNIQTMAGVHINDLNLLQRKIKLFKNNMLVLKDELLKIPEIQNDSFGFVNPLIKKFIKNLQNNITHFNDFIISPLDSFIYSFNFATSNNLTILNQIKCDLCEEKKNLINKRDIYFNYMNELSENEEKKSKNNFFTEISDKLSKKDEKIYNNAMKENYAQIYQYELNRMNEIIEESNKKYNNVNHEISAIKASLKLTIKDCLIKFSNNLSEFGATFNTLSEEIVKKIDSLNSFKNEAISQSIKNNSRSENEPRFEKEILETFEIKKEKIKVDTKEKNIEKNTEKNEKKGLFGFFKKRKSVVETIINLDLSKIEKSEQQKVQEEQVKNEKYMDEIIKEIVSEEELKSKKISNLFNIINELNNENENSMIFLNKLKKFYKHRVISFKNKNNFHHLSNIMNDLCLKHQNNNNIINLVIEVSQMIKYKKDYIYKIIQKKNALFSTKTFWIQLIDNDLIESLNKFADILLSKKIEDKNNTKEADEDKVIILEKIGLNKKIINYKKFKLDQKKELFQYAKEKLCVILSKNISGMCCFLVPENIINEIIVYYGAQFKLEYDIKCYLKNKMIVKNMKVIHHIKVCADKDEKLNNKIICISSLSKYYPINQLPTLLKLNKKIYEKLRKGIFLTLLSDKNLPINSHIILWKEYLQIEKIKKDFKYKDIKEGISLSAEKGKVNVEIGEEKSVYIIEKDLLRTLFIQKNKSHFNNLKSILICFLIMFPKIGYCQGMNCVVSFLYQLLDYNEEETFYFLCGLELNTKYHEIFQDNFETLKTYFIIFEKILNINNPEIYYKFMDNKLMTNSYMSPWFITLFTDNIFIFKKDDPPKLVFFVIEKFILEGWSVILNCGFTLLEYCYEKIMILEKDKLISYVMNLMEREDILKNENFDRIKQLYLKNAILINEFFIEKLIEITKFEEQKRYLNENINLIGNGV